MAATSPEELFGGVPSDNEFKWHQIRQQRLAMTSVPPNTTAVVGYDVLVWSVGTTLDEPTSVCFRLVSPAEVRYETLRCWVLRERERDASTGMHGQKVARLR